MPTREFADTIYPKFGVKAYHDAGHWGHGTSIYIIDTGLTNSSDRIQNVKVRTLTNTMGPKNTHGSFVASIVGPKVSNKTESQRELGLWCLGPLHVSACSARQHDGECAKSGAIQ